MNITLMLLVLVVIIYLILLDELVMSSAQRRFGPFNIGVFGLLASIVNGINLIIIQSFFIMSSYSVIMFLGPLIFLFILLLFFSFLLPMFIIDVFFVYFIIILLSSILVFVYFLLSYASFSKYSIIGSFRIVTQFLAFGLIFDVLLSIFLYIFSFLSFSLFSLSLYSSISCVNVFFNSLWLSFIWYSHSYYLLIFFNSFRLFCLCMSSLCLWVSLHFYYYHTIIYSIVIVITSIYIIFYYLFIMSYIEPISYGILLLLTYYTYTYIIFIFFNVLINYCIISYTYLFDYLCHHILQHHTISPFHIYLVSWVTQKWHIFIDTHHHFLYSISIIKLYIMLPHMFYSIKFNYYDYLSYLFDYLKSSLCDCITIMFMIIFWPWDYYFPKIFISHSYLHSPCIAIAASSISQQCFYWVFHSISPSFFNLSHAIKLYPTSLTFSSPIYIELHWIGFISIGFLYYSYSCCISLFNTNQYQLLLCYLFMHCYSYFEFICLWLLNLIVPWFNCYFHWFNISLFVSTLFPIYYQLCCFYFITSINLSFQFINIILLYYHFRVHRIGLLSLSYHYSLLLNYLYYFCLNYLWNSIFTLSSFSFVVSMLACFPLLLFIVFNMCILVESNRVPFDLPEAESELVAGFMTEFSSLYFSIIILSEYFSLIIFSLFTVLLFNLNVLLSIILLLFYCLTRATLNRLKYDELLSFGWYFLLIITFALFMLIIFI